MAGIYTEVWSRFIQEKLTSDDSFMKFSVDHTPWVNNNVVHLPQAGGPSNIVRNRSSLPATISERSDFDLTYTLDHFTSDPKTVFEPKAMELSYDKLNSTFGQDLKEMKEEIADWMIYKWANVAASGSSMIIVSGFTFNDLLNLKAEFTKDRVSTRGIKLLVDTNYATDIYKFDRFENTNDLNNKVGIDGYIGRVAGFDIFERDKVIEANTATTTFLNPDVASGTSALPAIIAWNPDYVARADGPKKRYLLKEDPSYYGSVMSIGARAGGSHLRADGKGIYSLVDTNKTLV